MSTKLSLLKLRKRELIKKCKKYKLNTNGNKKDMIDRLLKNNSFLKDENTSQNIDITPNLTPKSKSKRKRKSNNNVVTKIINTKFKKQYRKPIVNWLKVAPMTSLGKTWIGFLSEIYNRPYVYSDELFLELMNTYYPNHNNDKFKNKILPFHDFDCSFFSYCSFAIDIHNNMIYAPCCTNMYKYNVITKKLDITKISYEKSEDYGWTTPNSTKPTCIKIDTKLHIFGLYNDDFTYGTNHNVHQIYDINTDKIISDKDEIDCIKYSPYDFSMVHIGSQNKLIFASGRFTNKDKIIEYNIGTKEWYLRAALEEGDNSIEEAAMLVTNDERYVLIFYTYRLSRTYNDKIEIYDTEKMLLRKSNKKLPKDMYFRQRGGQHNEIPFKVFIIDESDTIIIGYFVEYLRHIKFEIPFELIYLIRKFYSKEYVHLIKQSTNEHWKISVDDILGEN